MIFLICVLWWVHFQFTNGNFFFVSHDSYEGFTLDGASFTAMRILGNNYTVTQQCRRACVVDPNCKAYDVQLLNGALSLGAFECRLYSLNLCNWQFVSLQNTTVMSSKVWDKLSGTTMKPKPCAEYCGVKYKGNCQFCRNSTGFTGIECDEPPRLCSDLALPLTDPWSFRLVHPWGFNGLPLQVLCQGKKTAMLRIGHENKTNRLIDSLGWSITQRPNSFLEFQTIIKRINWTLISEFQEMSIEKKLHLSVTIDENGPYERIYTGFQISSNGTLSLNGLVGNANYPGFPTPLINAPFIYDPAGSDSDCGAFWKLTPNVVVCNQRIRLLNFGRLIWNGQPSNYLGSAIFSFT